MKSLMNRKQLNVFLITTQLRKEDSVIIIVPVEQVLVQSLICFVQKICKTFHLLQPKFINFSTNILFLFIFHNHKIIQICYIHAVFNIPF